MDEGKRDTEALLDADLIGHLQDATDVGESVNREMKKGVLRARAWLMNPDPVTLTPEIATALAEDVVRFAAVVIRFRRERNECFADYVMSRLDP